jgi:hypothetical protein
MAIKTGSWFMPITPDHVRVGISRGVPRGMPAGYRRFTPLNPGPWFNSVAPEVYLQLYRTEILDQLDPANVVAAIERAMDGRTAVLCCYESVAKIEAGEAYCHRHIAAAWLEDRLGLEIEEVGAPQGFDRWPMLRRLGIKPPTYP